ncbi:hypothetical protein LCGC14_0337890 [marine sediment metagenome]|uniref:Uncharacterized protein n=1 Tax=marine sediment metagenome TaxID=412755 RepID=A0A0F9TEE0_9ZZZZ
MAGITFDDLSDKQKNAAHEHFSTIYTRNKLVDALMLVERVEKIEKDLKGWASAYANFFDQYEAIDGDGKKKIGEILRLMKLDDKEIFEKVSRLREAFDTVGEI